MPPKYGPSSTNCIGAEELLTSSQLAQRLVGNGRSQVAARQQLARLARRNDVWRSAHLQLPHRERLFAHPSAIGTPAFLSAVEAAMGQHRPGLARCIAAIRHHKAILRPLAQRLLAIRNPSEYARAARALEEIGIATAVDQGTALERL